MQTLIDKSYLLFTRILFSSLSLMCLFTTSWTYLKQIQEGGSPWKTGDWLISFEAGYIRRGLIGELIMKTNEFTGIGILKIVFALQVGLLFVFLGLLNRIVWSQSIDILTMGSLFSPAFILFYILDPQGSLRKEIIGFIILLFCSNLRPQTSKSKIVLILINVIYFVFIFSWEAGVIFLFPILYLLHLNLPSVQIKKSVERRLLFTLIGQSILIVAITPFFRGTPKQVISICNGLITKGINSKICEGAISNLSLSSEDSYLEFIRLYQTQGYGNYFLILVFTMIPLVYTLSQKKKIQMLFVLSPYLILFVIAWDYGRWINVIITSTIIFVLYFQKEDQMKSSKVMDKVLALIYFVASFFWGMHHFGYPYIESFYSLYLS